MALLSHWAPVYGQEGKTKIRIAIPSASICCFHLFAAQQWKVFDDNGLDVEIVQMRPQVANAAMVSGEIHYFAGVGPNSVAATLRGTTVKGSLVCIGPVDLFSCWRVRSSNHGGASLQAASAWAVWATPPKCR